MTWSKSSWRDKPIKQQPEYGDLEKLNQTTSALSKFPGIVSFDEIDALKNELKLVQEGKSFILQGGDCAEAFANFSEQNIHNYLRLFLQMNAILMYGTLKNVVKIGRIAGQFAKPRSSNTEMIDGVMYQAYRGDIVNDINTTHEARQAEPGRILEAYFKSAATLNYIRALTHSGFASLNKIQEWNLEFLHETGQKNPKFEAIITGISSNLKFVEACKLDLASQAAFHQASFFTSHEALLLNYEEPLTRYNKLNGKHYCLSSHMLWIGDRTRSIKEGHVEFLRGVANPIGIKVGTTTDVKELIDILNVVNPSNESGKMILISRMGSQNIKKILPDIVKAVQDSGQNIIWQCDPMHGNTIKSDNGYKTRKVQDIVSEIEQFFDIHNSLSSYAGGVHLEMTGNNVTECLGGLQDIKEINLQERYHTHCDPRLNSIQSLEVAFLIADKLRKA